MSLLTGMFYEQTDSDKTLKSHFHNAHEIIYIIEGSARFVIENNSYDTKKGDLIFISNFENHSVDILTRPYKRFYLLLDQTELNRFINEPYLVSFFRNRPHGFNHCYNVTKNKIDDFSNCFRKLLEEYNSNNDFRELALESIFMDFLVLFLRNFKPVLPGTRNSGIYELISEIQNYVEENFRQDLSLEEVSAKFFIDMYYLSKQFKSCTGYNFKKFLILLRISKAKELLYLTDLPVTEVALKSGFGNVNHFIRIFGKYTGMSPGVYRKKLLS